jgi:hypothetical protein
MEDFRDELCKEACLGEEAAHEVGIDRVHDLVYQLVVFIVLGVEGTYQMSVQDN